LSTNQQSDPNKTSQEGWEHAILINSTSDGYIPKAEITEKQTSKSSKKGSKFFKPLKKFKTWAELIGLTVLIWYAYTTRNLWIESQNQTRIAESGNRPWIKILDVTLTHLQDFETLRFLTMPQVDKSYPAATIQTVITIQNIGKGVAQHVFIYPVLEFDKINSQELPSAAQRRACSQLHGQTPGPDFEWSAVFPEEKRLSPITTLAFYDTSMYFPFKDRTGDWISGSVFVCVSYQAPLPYNTSVRFSLGREGDRFIEVGKPINDPAIRLLRDPHSEYAQ
jgi:hypothetical protein